MNKPSTGTRKYAAIVSVVTFVLAAIFAAAAPASAVEALSTWKCQTTSYPSVEVSRCARFSVFNEKFKIDYTRSFQNQYYDRSVQFQCSTSKQSTWNFEVSASAEAEAGVIFAKAKVSTTVTIAHSVTTTDSVSATVTVKPREWANCKRGAYVFDITGTYKSNACNAGGCKATSGSFTAHAPSRDVFLIGPGRG